MVPEFKSMLKQTSIYGVFNILGKGVGFLMLPLYTRYLEPADYGTLELVEITAFFFEAFAGVGLTYAIFKFYHHYDTEQERNKVCSTALTSLLSLHGLVAVLGVLLSPFLSNLIFKDPSYQPFLILVFIRILVSGAISLGIDYLRLVKRPTLYGVLSLSRLVSALILNVVFLVFLGWGVKGVLISSIISAFLVGLPLIVYLYKHFGFHFDFSKLLQMVKYGMPFVVVMLGQFAINSADRFILKQFTTLSDVGLYSLGYRFGFMVNFLIVTPFQLMWEGKMFEIGKRSDAAMIYSRVLTYLILALVFAALCLTVFIDEILKIMATPAYFAAGMLVPFIASAYIFNGLQEYFRLGMLLKSKTSIVGIIMLGQSILSIGLYLLVIPFWGAKGAALAVVLSYMAIFSANFICSQKLLHVPLETKRIFVIIVSAIIIAVAKFFMPSLGLLLALFVDFGLMILFVLVLIGLGFLNREEKLRLRKMTLRLEEQMQWR